MVDPAPAFSIRPIRDVDGAAVLEVYRQCEDFLALGPVAQASAEMVAGDRALSLRAGGVYCGIFMSVFSSTPAGVDLVGILDYAPDYGGEAGVVFIELLMIVPAYRGQGLGEAVLNWLLAETRPRLLRTAVQVNNPGALRFWQRLGFFISGPEEIQQDGTVTYPIVRNLR